MYKNSNGDALFGLCQNCDAPLTLEQARHGTLFCSEKCKQTASVVRYGRATREDGRYERDPQVREVIRTRIALILGGGYPEKARQLSPEKREEIFVRDGRRCRLCGAPATEIDHIAGSSSDPANLQALCGRCNLAKAQANFRPASLEQVVEGQAIRSRISAAQPVRPCDDEKHWKVLQRELAATQRQRARRS